MHMRAQVTHRLEELDYADGATYMEEGQVLRTGTGRDIRRWAEQQAQAYAAQVEAAAADMA